MTVVKIIGKQINKPEDNKIEFHKQLNSNLTFGNCNNTPNSYKYIELISLNYTSGYDLMFAYDDPNNRGFGILYIGKFNDGIV